MVNRATFTLDQEAYAFLMSAGKDNKSAYISTLLKKEKKRQLEKAMLKANEEEARDPEYQEELAIWEETSADGL